MATVTSVGSGNWGTTTTWDTGTVPVDGDTVVISAGHTVIFDADQSTFASGLAGLTVNGTLKFITDGTVTYLKMAGHISGTGDFYCGTEDNPIPAPTTSEPVVATICFNGNYWFTLTDELVFYGEMREGYTTTATESGSTDTTITLTDDLNLRAGDVVYISHPTAGANATTHTVQDYNSTTRMVTFTSQLGRVISVGMGVTLDSRNIQCMNLNKTASSKLVDNKNNGVAVGVRFYNFAIGPIYYSNNWLIKYCTGNNNTYGGITHQGSGHILTNCIGNNNTFGGITYYGSGYILTNCIGNNNTYGGITHQGNGHILTNCIGNNNTYGGITHYGSGYILTNCIGNNNTYGGISCCGDKFVLINCHKGVGNTNGTCYASQDFTAYNSELELINTTPVGNQVFHQFQSYDHNQIENNYCSWMYGGTIETLLVEGVAQPDQLIFKPVSNTAPVFRDFDTVLPKGKWISYLVTIKKDFDGGIIKVELIDPKNDPLIDNTAEAIKTVTSPNIKDKPVNLSFMYRAETNKKAKIRVSVQNSSGNVQVNVIRLFKGMGTFYQF